MTDEIQQLALPAELADRITACGMTDHAEAFSVAMDAVMGGWAGDELAKLATAIDHHHPARREVLCKVGLYGYHPVPPEATAELVRLGVVRSGEGYPWTKLGRKLQDQIVRVWNCREDQ